MLIIIFRIQQMGKHIMVLLIFRQTKSYSIQIKKYYLLFLIQSNLCLQLHQMAYMKYV